MQKSVLNAIRSELVRVEGELQSLAAKKDALSTALQALSQTNGYKPAVAAVVDMGARSRGVSRDEQRAKRSEALDKIAKLHNHGMKTGQIADELGLKKQYVYAATVALRKEGRLKRG